MIFHSAWPQQEIVDFIKNSLFCSLCHIEKGKEESFDHEFVRAAVRAKALVIGMNIADRLKKNGRHIRVDDLHLDNARKQLKSYRKELARIDKEHKGHIW